jgi:hypothetical protein
MSIPFNLEVGEIEVVEPVLRIDENGYSFGENAIVDCGSCFVVVDDRGLVIGTGGHPDTAKIDVWARIAEYIKASAPYVDEYWIDYTNEDAFSFI